MTSFFAVKGVTAPPAEGFFGRLRMRASTSMTTVGVKKLPFGVGTPVAFAANDHPGAVRNSVAQVRFDFLDGARVDQRADLAIATAGRSSARRPSRPACRTNFVDRLLNVTRFGQIQVWPGIAEFSTTSGRRRRPEVGIIEHDKRRVAAQLQRQALERIGAWARGACQRRRTGEGKSCGHGNR